jgi:hypothetical protein
VIISLEHGFSENGLNIFQVKQPPKLEPAPVKTIVCMRTVFKFVPQDPNIANIDITVTSSKT